MSQSEQKSNDIDPEILAAMERVRAARWKCIERVTGRPYTPSPKVNQQLEEKQPSLPYADK
jgi:hypothetical protein